METTVRRSDSPAGRPGRQLVTLGDATKYILNLMSDQLFGASSVDGSLEFATRSFARAMPSCTT
jgi:hypothetical protein